MAGVSASLRNDGGSSLEIGTETETVQEGEDLKETGRVEGFSDGVFAIAITLLVLDLNVPAWSPHGIALTTDLEELWPAYLAFLTSFATIAIMWINHHRVFRLIKRSDTGLMIFNALVLLGVTLIPFPTKILHEYIGHDPDEDVAAILYSVLFVLISIFYVLLWWYASAHDRLLGRNVNRREADAITRQFSIGPLLYAVALIMAILAMILQSELLTTLSVLLDFAVAVFYALPASMFVHASKRSSG